MNSPKVLVKPLGNMMASKTASIFCGSNMCLYHHPSMIPEITTEPLKDMINHLVMPIYGGDCFHTAKMCTTQENLYQPSILP